MSKKKANIEGGPGGPTGSGRPQPGIFLSGGGTVSVNNGSSVLVRFTVTRSFTSTAVTFAAGNLPPGVSAQFSPATLPSGNGSANLTLELVAGPSALPAQTVITIVASGTNVPPSTLHVHLTVVSPFSEIAGAPWLPINAGGASQTINMPNVLLAPSSQVTTGFNLQFAAGVQGKISFKIGNLPSGVTVQFEPSPLTAPGKAGPVGVQIVLSAGANVTATIVALTVDVVIAGFLRGTLNFSLQIVTPGGSSNYLLYSSCQSLIDVSVKISVTQDLVAAPPGPNQQHGFSFQLNAWSPPNPANPNLIVWQQYIIGVGSGKVRAAVNNWTTASISGTQPINPVAILATLPKPDMIPAGYSITIALKNDAQGNVSGVTYTTSTGESQEFTLTDLTKTNGQPVTSADLAPIVVFALVIVGPGDGRAANFVSGAGSITYTAANVLQPLASFPACVADAIVTEETSNSVYGGLPMQPSRSFTQTFSA